jgi:hypothetical protein
MNTNIFLALVTAAVLGIAACGVAACNKSAAPANSIKAQQYTCPMHPEVVKEAPGNCPKCGMTLVDKN